MAPLSSTETQTTALLVDRVVAGSRQAFDDLYHRTVDEVRGWIASRSYRWEMVDECLQQTYLTAFRHLDNFRRDGSLTAWLIGIARNEIGKYLRRERRLAPPGTTRLIDHHLDGLDEDPQPVGDLGERLDRCLQRLGERLRSLVLQRYVDGRAVERIAAEAGRSANATSVALHRARQRLRQCLEDAVG